MGPAKYVRPVQELMPPGALPLTSNLSSAGQSAEAPTVNRARRLHNVETMKRLAVGDLWKRTRAATGGAGGGVTDRNTMTLGETRARPVPATLV
jgi:hypothetical protein